mmetsp:Transcript_25581/g.89143  ORF Transcript_25581/g.89143 Transcript_25581/m.89143 type:complete len:458 (+) Transcript_25581:1034-2407(+)
MPLQERRERELLPQAALAGRAHALAGVDGKRDHNALRVVDAVLDVVARLCERLQQLRVPRQAHAAQVEARLGVVHARRGAGQQRHGAARLDARRLDGPRDGEPVRVDAVVVCNGVVPLLAPAAQFVEPAVGDHLRHAAHTAADAAVAQHDAIRDRPVRLAQRHRLGVQVRVLERLLVVLDAFVVVRERLHQAAQLKGLERLLEAGVAAAGAPVLVVRRATHAAVALHVLQPREAWLAVLRDALADVGIVHSQLREHRIVARPAVRGSVRVRVVVFQVDVIVVKRVAERDFRRLANVARHHALADEVHDVHDGRHGERVACERRQHAADRLVQLLQRLRPGGDATKAADGLPCGPDGAVVKHRVDAAKEPRVEDERHRVHPPLARIRHDVLLCGRIRRHLARALDNDRLGATRIESDADAQHRRVHEEAERPRRALLHPLGADKRAVVQRREQAPVLR